MNQVLIIGAFDRYNYGDLLFPLVIKKQLNEINPDFSFNFFGLVKSDLTGVGGVATEDLLTFYKSCSQADKKVSIIIAGGEAIDASWSSLFAALNTKFQTLEWVIRKTRLPIPLNNFARMGLKGRTTFPFTFSKSEFDGVKAVIYNSLGGSNVPNLSQKDKARLSEIVKDVDYLSVRDKLTQKNIQNLGGNSQLFPDSAILMSKFFPKDKLYQLVSKQVSKYVEENKNNYLFFQVNKNFGKYYNSELGRNLEKISKEFDTQICLCPIGIALNHEDQDGLLSVKATMNIDSQLFSDVTIWDIMYLIANSKAYMGTSLHGAITAMSFAIPYIGLAITKLNSYLETWGVEGINHVYAVKDMVSGFKNAISVDSHLLRKSASYQIMKSEESFEIINDILCQ